MDEIVNKFVYGQNLIEFKGSEEDSVAGVLFFASKRHGELYNLELDTMFLATAGAYGDNNYYIPHLAHVNAEKAVGNDIEKAPYFPKQLESIKYVIKKLREEKINVIYREALAQTFFSIEDQDIENFDRIAGLLNFKEKNDSLALYNSPYDTIAALFFDRDTISAKPSDIFVIERNHLRIIVPEDTSEYLKVVDLIKDCDRELGYSKENTPAM